MESYPYGFNGKEKDDEINSIEGAYDDFGARMYDSRLGRWMSRDPKESYFPGISTYAFAYNSPLAFNDPTGESGRLSINYETKTMVMEQTVHLYGADLVAGTADALNKLQASLDPTRIVKDKDGNEWTVTIKTTYTEVNAGCLNDETADSPQNIPNQKDFNPTELLNFQPGDYILKVDRKVNIGTASGQTNSDGGVASKRMTTKTFVHEPLHGFGYNDSPSGFVCFDPECNDRVSDKDFYNGKSDAMQYDNDSWEIKNRHYTDLVDFVTANYKETINVVLQDAALSKPRDKFLATEEREINSRVRKQEPKTNSKKPSGKSTPKAKF